MDKGFLFSGWEIVALLCAASCHLVARFIVTAAKVVGSELIEHSVAIKGIATN